MPCFLPCTYIPSTQERGEIAFEKNAVLTARTSRLCHCGWARCTHVTTRAGAILLSLEGRMSSRPRISHVAGGLLDTTRPHSTALSSFVTHVHAPFSRLQNRTSVAPSRGIAHGGTAVTSTECCWLHARYVAWWNLDGLAENARERMSTLRHHAAWIHFG